MSSFEDLCVKVLCAAFEMFYKNVILCQKHNARAQDAVQNFTPCSSYRYYWTSSQNV
eukprot:TRINITY_DN286_c0_g1_i2.p2 TRINITY_DN286_c0_g1~~TRINITY_DN286_c0_g1_i2.p2  ORF type:complete len:57 (+),score=2.63 TRINITY_DN286_c0_g1_i2:612-782(+)